MVKREGLYYRRFDCCFFERGCNVCTVLGRQEVVFLVIEIDRLGCQDRYEVKEVMYLTEVSTPIRVTMVCDGYSEERMLTRLLYRYHNRMGDVEKE